MRISKRIQVSMKARGIELRKAPASRYRPLPIFGLAVTCLMHHKGQVLRFVQVGANDGMYSDPLREYIIGNGWTGLLIEPQPDVFECLKANYAKQVDRLIFENVAISETRGSIEIFRLRNTEAAENRPMPHSLTVSSMNAKIVASQVGVGKENLVAISVPTMRLDDLIESHNFKDIDILQIDVEGFERQVLNSINLSKHRPRLIQFEHGHLNRSDIEFVTQYLTKADYLIAYGGHETDSIAMSLEFAQASGWLID